MNTQDTGERLSGRAKMESCQSLTYHPSDFRRLKGNKKIPFIIKKKKKATFYVVVQFILEKEKFKKQVYVENNDATDAPR